MPKHYTEKEIQEQRVHIGRLKDDLFEAERKLERMIKGPTYGEILRERARAEEMHEQARIDEMIERTFG